jgi:hypothetical protein
MPFASVAGQFLELSLSPAVGARYRNGLLGRNGSVGSKSFVEILV